MNSHVFEKINRLESQNKFIDAIIYSSGILFNQEFKALHKLIQQNIQRILQRIYDNIYSYWQVPIPVYELNKNPNTYAFDVREMSVDRLPIVISLTTISGRLARVSKTIESLVNQTSNIHSINLYISQSPFLLDDGIDINSSILKSLHSMGVNIYCVPNIGPYRKQIPIIFQLKSSKAPAMTPIITMDDDVLYPNNICERLLFVQDYVVVAHRGRAMILNEHDVGSYSKFIAPQHKRSHHNIGTGKNGILYRLGFFSDNIAVYGGPLVAPTADDLWCKWVSGFACIPTEILEPEAAYNPKLDFEESDPKDKNGLYHKFNNKGNNDVAIRCLETYYTHVFGKNLFDIYTFGK